MSNRVWMSLWKMECLKVTTVWRLFSEHLRCDAIVRIVTQPDGKSRHDLSVDRDRWTNKKRASPLPSIMSEYTVRRSRKPNHGMIFRKILRLSVADRVGSRGLPLTPLDLGRSDQICAIYLIRTTLSLSESRKLCWGTRDVGFDYLYIRLSRQRCFRKRIPLPSTRIEGGGHRFHAVWAKRT